MRRVFFFALALAACDTKGGTAIPCASNQDCPVGTTCSTAGVAADTAETDVSAPAPMPVAAGSCVTVAGAPGAGGDTVGGSGVPGAPGSCPDVAGSWTVSDGGCFPAGELGVVAQNGCTVTITPASSSATIPQASMTSDGIAFRVLVTARTQQAYDCKTTFSAAGAASGSCTITPGGGTCSISITKG